MSFIKLRIYQSVLGDVEILVYDSLGTIGRSCTGNGKLYTVMENCIPYLKGTKDMTARCESDDIILQIAGTEGLKL